MFIGVQICSNNINPVKNEIALESPSFDSSLLILFIIVHPYI